MSERASSELEEALREAVLEQVANNEPPEAAAALARLEKQGIPEDEAIRLLSAALFKEMSLMIRDDRAYDEESYAATLNRLPTLIQR